MLHRSHAINSNRFWVVCTLVSCALVGGCHDGPLYALKAVNPFFTNEWKRDQELGVTDHERREQLGALASKIGSMPAGRQKVWAEHLHKILDNDESPEMRRLAINAAGNLKTPDAVALIEKGMDDESTKVRMEACRSLGKRTEPEAIQMLASTIGSETNVDVKQAAIAAIGKQRGNVPIDSMRAVLRDPNPATRDLAMNSLRRITGKSHGRDPEQWIAAIDKQSIGPPTIKQDDPDAGKNRTRLVNAIMDRLPGKQSTKR